MFVFADCDADGACSKHRVGFNFTANVLHFIQDIVTSTFLTYDYHTEHKMLVLAKYAITPCGLLIREHTYVPCIRVPKIGKLART